VLAHNEQLYKRLTLHCYWRHILTRIFSRWTWHSDLVNNFHVVKTHLKWVRKNFSIAEFGLAIWFLAPLLSTFLHSPSCTETVVFTRVFRTSSMVTNFLMHVALCKWQKILKNEHKVNPSKGSCEWEIYVILAKIIKTCLKLVVRRNFPSN